ncbi:hypothetical protein BDQ17DRAFT_1367679 [Cyathus striatus]|nr:hypothetical protein BDQ17DRAFT_1381538 [Cyathus striatus]KAF8993906.1 hypothetical protein BDQ17DRAFT_1367679 [Cyathus striatus]
MAGAAGGHRLLIIEYVAMTAEGHSAEKAIERKDKPPLPLPVSDTFVLASLPIPRALFPFTAQLRTVQYVGRFASPSCYPDLLHICG